jgi:hypothetical protein
MTHHTDQSELKELFDIFGEGKVPPPSLYKQP